MRGLFFSFLMAFSLLFALSPLGCKKKEEGKKKTRPDEDLKKDEKKKKGGKKETELSHKEKVAQGKKLLRKMMCRSCHRIGRQGGSNGPELTNVGAKFIRLKGSKEKARQWFVKHLINPEKYPGTEAERYISAKMPSYREHLSDDQLEYLATYLLTLRGERDSNSKNSKETNQEVK